MKREIVVGKCFDKIKSIKPVSGKSWVYTSRTPFNRLEATKCPGFYFFDFSEERIGASTRKDLIHFQCNAVLEIWMTHNLSDSASTLLNEVLDAVRTNIQGWTADIEFSMEEIGNKYKVDPIS